VLHSRIIAKRSGAVAARIPYPRLGDYSKVHPTLGI
jgi:hypothetical protein